MYIIQCGPKSIAEPHFWNNVKTPTRYLYSFDIGFQIYTKKKGFQDFLKNLGTIVLSKFCWELFSAADKYMLASLMST